MKAENEDILQKLDISFFVTIPNEPRTIDTMSDHELNEELQHSYEQLVAREGKTYIEIFDEWNISTLSENVNRKSFIMIKKGMRCGYSIPTELSDEIKCRTVP